VSSTGFIIHNCVIYKVLNNLKIPGSVLAYYDPSEFVLVLLHRTTVSNFYVHFFTVYDTKKSLHREAYSGIMFSDMERGLILNQVV